MALASRSRRLAAVNTEEAQWVVPTPVAVGVLLLCPIDRSIQQVFTFWHAGHFSLSSSVVATGMILRAVEILAGLSFVAGPGTRLAGYPVVAIFAVRAVANCANSFAWLRDLLSSMIVPHGDWGYGAKYFGAALLLGEVRGCRQLPLVG